MMLTRPSSSSTTTLLVARQQISGFFDPNLGSPDEV